MSLQPAPQVPQTATPAVTAEPTSAEATSATPTPEPVSPSVVDALLATAQAPALIATFGLRFVPMAEVQRIGIHEFQTPAGAHRTVAIPQDLQDWLIKELKLRGPVTYEHCDPALQLLESKLYAQLAEIKRARAIVNSALSPATPGGYTDSVL